MGEIEILEITPGNGVLAIKVKFDYGVIITFNFLPSASDEEIINHLKSAYPQYKPRITPLILGKDLPEKIRID